MTNKLAYVVPLDKVGHYTVTNLSIHRNSSFMNPSALCITVQLTTSEATSNAHPNRGGV